MQTVKATSCWKVYIDRKYVGIIESNFPYASMYWKEQSRRHGYKVRLARIEYNAATGAWDEVIH